MLLLGSFLAQKFPNVKGGDHEILTKPPESKLLSLSEKFEPMTMMTPCLASSSTISNMHVIFNNIFVIHYALPFIFVHV